MADSIGFRRVNEPEVSATPGTPGCVDVRIELVGRDDVSGGWAGCFQGLVREAEGGGTAARITFTESPDKCVVVVESPPCEQVDRFVQKIDTGIPAADGLYALRYP
ncbi:hypothetical protein [Nocardia fluminea]|uniref:hypothetical protein n=1 Tax=Nocardia fluminea TaxID=134984 RepID=UPI001180A751|nr:hypothetical protein [Nocardia fluminea]